jgi:hypothetical protein
MKLAITFLIGHLLIWPVNAFCQRASLNRSPYIGFKYKSVRPGVTLPNGVKHFGGGLIGDIKSDPIFGISEVGKGKTKMLWLEISTGQDASGISGWHVKDVLSFPTLAKTDYVVFALDPSIECTRNGVPILDSLVAVGRIYRTKGIFKPTKAWVANFETAKFEEIPAASLKCNYSEP